MGAYQFVRNMGVYNLTNYVDLTFEFVYSFNYLAFQTSYWHVALKQITTSIEADRQR